MCGIGGTEVGVDKGSSTGTCCAVLCVGIAIRMDEKEVKGNCKSEQSENERRWSEN